MLPCCRSDAGQSMNGSSENCTQGFALAGHRLECVLDQLPRPRSRRRRNRRPVSGSLLATDSRVYGCSLLVRVTGIDRPNPVALADTVAVMRTTSQKLPKISSDGILPCIPRPMFLSLPLHCWTRLQAPSAGPSLPILHWWHIMLLGKSWPGLLL